MEDFFGRRYMNSSPYQYQRSYKTRSRDIPVESKFSSPKVVSIPIHYVRSSNRSKAAMGIQKVVRGFFVRKRVKAILGIKKEVDEIEKKFRDKGLFFDLLKKDGKERLKLNEVLMGLLFKLDSIRGIDFGIRELRKAVISKVIMLQERLDSIVSEQENVDQDGVEDVEQNWELVSDFGEKLGQEEDNFDEKVEKQEALNGEVVKEGNLGENCSKKDEEGATIETEWKQEGKNDNGMKELMEKMMSKNEMLIGMVADLCEKNKVQVQVNHMQARVINSLLKRVDNLEKSLRNEQSKCKKQRKPVAGSQDANKKP
ncbi:Bcl-2-associated athanogene [Thalictrum thalictroides]|uniref:Bcl-2-associated athanogene n=1 Tax=Thalictrum thalictroides TaxID=46969 RepID=A0A7J6XG06_THATH|nr:Bcl-2-associated athanogene [Thalictrum thalictroides]